MKLCAYCREPIKGRLNPQRKWCGPTCRKHGRYGRTLQREKAVETKRERYLRQCAETAWM